MKKNITMLIIAIVLFVCIPLLVVTVVSSNVGMIVSIFLLLVVYPVFFISNGIMSMNNMKKNWFTPLVFVGIFAVSFMAILDIKEPFYSVMYLVLGYITMIGGFIIKKMSKKK